MGTVVLWKCLTTTCHHDSNIRFDSGDSASRLRVFFLNEGVCEGVGGVGAGRREVGGWVEHVYTLFESLFEND